MFCAELKAVQAQKKGLRRPVSELKNGTHCFDETGEGVDRIVDSVDGWGSGHVNRNLIISFEILVTGKKVPKLPNTSKEIKANGVKKSETMHAIPNKVLNRYSIGQVIGEGNFAVVRRCSDKYVLRAVFWNYS